MKIRYYQQKKKDYIIYKVFQTNIVINRVIKKKNPETQTKKEDKEENIIENHQTKEPRDTKRNNEDTE